MQTPPADSVHLRPADPDGLRRLGGEVVRFVLVGSVAIGGHLVLFVLLGTVLPAVVANVAASVITNVAATPAHRRTTFRLPVIRGRVPAEQLKGLVVTVACLAMTSAVVAATDPWPTGPAQLALVAAATGAAGLARFVLLRYWVFGRRRTGR